MPPLPQRRASRWFPSPGGEKFSIRIPSPGGEKFSILSPLLGERVRVRAKSIFFTQSFMFLQPARFSGPGVSGNSLPHLLEERIKVRISLVYPVLI